MKIVVIIKLVLPVNLKNELINKNNIIINVINKKSFK